METKSSILVSLYFPSQLFVYFFESFLNEEKSIKYLCCYIDAANRNGFADETQRGHLLRLQIFASFKFKSNVYAQWMDDPYRTFMRD